MAASVVASVVPVEEPPQVPLQYQTWVLKVSIHCQGCKRKIKRVLHSIEGVYRTEIDFQLQKVTIIGNVDPQNLIKKLIKSRRHAELWPDDPTNIGNEKKENSEKQCESKSSENSEDEAEEEQNPVENNNFHLRLNSPRITGGNGGPCVKFVGIDSFTLKPPVNVTTQVAEQKEIPTALGGKKKKKKKKKKKNGNNNNAGPGNANGGLPGTILETQKISSTQVVDQVNLSPSLQNVYHYSPNYVPQQGYAVSYNTTQPTINGYYMAPSMYTYADYEEPEDDYQMQSSKLGSFEVLSDENPNACYIM